MSAIGKLLILKLDGTCQTGFRVMAELREEGNHTDMEDDGYLPPAPELISTLNQWQSAYRKLGGSLRGIRPESIVYEGSIRRTSTTLIHQFNQWLNFEGLVNLNLNLRRKLNPQDAIRIIIRTTDRQVHRLPWHQWTLIEEYRHAEISFSPFRFEKPHRLPKPKAELVRVLAILGDRTGIDISKDRQVLESLPNTEVEFLVEPTRQELNEQLWQSAWDILFFAGHSKTESTQGRIFINQYDSLTLDELKYGLKRAVEHGLQLAIFNSCDGLGLAYELEQLHMPQMIVMREPVPDLVAQEFLKTFLIELSSGASLYLAERTAREQLQGLEDQYPCASWLPAIYQNPTTLSINWKTLQNTSDEPFPPPYPTTRWQNWQVLLVIVFVITSLIVGIRALDFLQPLELASYDKLMYLRPKIGVDSRILVVTIDQADIDFQNQRGIPPEEDWSLSENALELLVQKLEPLSPNVIGLDIYHPNNLSPVLTNYINQSINFVGICEADASEVPLEHAPPSNLSADQVGFSDFPVDPDNVIRRQLLMMAGGKKCTTSTSFSARLAEQYLSQLDYPNPKMELLNGVAYLGSTAFPRFRYDSAGYRLPSEDYANGYQILLNRRYKTPQIISLKTLLTSKNSKLRPLVQDRVVLIGVDKNWEDHHFLVGKRQTQTSRVPGVVVHAHMVSQLLDATTNQSRLVWWWPKWLENLWIASWSFIGGMLAWRSGGWIYGLTYLGLAGILLCGINILILWVFSGWIPLIPSLAGLISAFCLTQLILKSDDYRDSASH